MLLQWSKTMFMVFRWVDVRWTSRAAMDLSQRKKRLVRMTFLALVISFALGKDAWLLCSSFATEV